MTNCLITACSNKYFPSVLNLIGSLKANYPNHPPIYVYDLGLIGLFKRQLSKINGVNILKIPPVPKFWRAGYVWKTYIFTKPLADLNFYLDAGAEVSAPLDSIFKIIADDDYFALTIDPGFALKEITPIEYKLLFTLTEEAYNNACLAAGVFGFKKDSQITDILNQTRAAALAGLTLGFSPAESWRNKGREKNIFVRDCPCFRHDQTILNLIMRQKLGSFKPHCQIETDRKELTTYLPGSPIRILGRNYQELPYAFNILRGKPGQITALKSFILIKRIRLNIKRALNLLK